jgi:hypothetical protein
LAPSPRYAGEQQHEDVFLRGAGGWHGFPFGDEYKNLLSIIPEGVSWM